jgi:hypothetical protein
MTIREWLSNPSDFEAGLQLYEKHGSSLNLKRLMRRSGETDRNKETLLYELGKIIDDDTNPPVRLSVSEDYHQPVVELPKPKGPEVKNFIIPEPEIIYDPEKEKQGSAPELVYVKQPDLPAIILHLEQQWKDLYKQSAYKQSNLEKMDPEERKEAAHFILDNFDKIKEIWKKVDHYKEHGQLPPEEVIKVTSDDPISLFQRKKTLSTYISKANNGVKYMDPKKIPDWEKEIEEIDKKLNLNKQPA